jgi:hypothetical protein
VAELLLFLDGQHQFAEADDALVQRPAELALSIIRDSRFAIAASKFAANVIDVSDIESRWGRSRPFGAAVVLGSLC